jgi:23S rRNA (guanosine2251-2'-O)-methyltransferase
MTDKKKEWIYGVNPVLEALKSGVSVDAIYVAEGRLDHLRQIVKAATERGVPVKAVGREFFEQRFPKGHQGVAAARTPRERLDVDDLLDVARERGEAPLIFVLDGVEDPRNFGAILRVAEAVGAHGVVHQSRRSAGVTAVVSKTSAGAVEHVNVVEVVNIKHAMATLQDSGVVLAGAEAEAPVDLWQADFTVPIALVLGSEGYGMRRTVRELCDILVRLPMRGRVNSLNVSVATGVLAYEVLRQRAESR